MNGEHDNAHGISRRHLRLLSHKDHVPGLDAELETVRVVWVLIDFSIFPPHVGHVHPSGTVEQYDADE